MKMKRLRVAIGIVGVWLIAATGTLHAREVSLSRALELAVQHSKLLHKADAERKSYEAALRAAEAARFPTLSAQAVAFYNTDVATLDLTLPYNQTLSREIGSKEHYQADLRLTLPLFTGGKITNSIRLAKARLARYQASSDAVYEQVLYQTWMKYLSLYKADMFLKAAQASLRRVEIMKNDVAALYAQGVADSVALLEADLAWEGAKLKVTEAANKRRSAEITLAVHLGLSVDDSLRVADELPLPDSSFLSRLDNGKTEILRKPEIQAAKAALTMSRAGISLSRAAFFPSLSVYGGYSYGKPNLDFFNNTWNDYFTVGAKLNWSFNFGGKQRRQTQQSMYLSRAAQHQYENTLEQLNQQKELAYEQLTLSYQKYVTAQQRYRLSSADYRLAVEKHRGGVLSSNRLLEIEAGLSEAEAATAATLVDYSVALSTYYFVVGSEQLKNGF